MQRYIKNVSRAKCYSILVVALLCRYIDVQSRIDS